MQGVVDPRGKGALHSAVYGNGELRGRNIFGVGPRTEGGCRSGAGRSRSFGSGGFRGGKGRTSE